MARAEPRHFSLLRDFKVADFLTLANGVCGMGAVLAFLSYCSDGNSTAFWVGTGLLPLALLFDVLDGRVARLRHESSAMGRELDSLADVVSFGVAPAVMGFAVGLRASLDLVCLVMFVACGIGRLARYNVTAEKLSEARGKVTYFEGFPIPSSLMLVVLLAALMAASPAPALVLGVWDLGPLALHPLALVFVLLGAGMISKTLRIPKP
ncbi:MAG: CDP-diacylglycerol--serine O-phosphatidyltransferase [Polyangiaceae bacterium]|jgi:CDP-diacylglycerol--serine O-phosphatidyltransferase|nr:CDP-diacylglycerol--serine O-phosphatidyltransferase [Polyangiaceae bacterium]